MRVLLPSSGSEVQGVKTSTYTDRSTEARQYTHYTLYDARIRCSCSPELLVVAGNSTVGEIFTQDFNFAPFESHLTQNINLITMQDYTIPGQLLDQTKLRDQLEKIECREWDRRRGLASSGKFVPPTEAVHLELPVHRMPASRFSVVTLGEAIDLDRWCARTANLSRHLQLERSRGELLLSFHQHHILGTSLRTCVTIPVSCVAADLW